MLLGAKKKRKKENIIVWCGCGEMIEISVSSENEKNVFEGRSRISLSSEGF